MSSFAKAGTANFLFCRQAVFKIARCFFKIQDVRFLETKPKLWLRTTQEFCDPLLNGVAGIISASAADGSNAEVEDLMISIFCR